MRVTVKSRHADYRIRATGNRTEYIFKRQIGQCRCIRLDWRLTDVRYVERFIRAEHAKERALDLQKVGKIPPEFLGPLIVGPLRNI